MEPHEWMPEGNGKKREEEFTTKKQEEADEKTKVKEHPEEGVPEDGIDGTIVEVRGEQFDPFERVAILALIDIAPKIKKIRLKERAELFHLIKPETIIGARIGATLKLDDMKTIKPEHAIIAFKNGEFQIFPQEGIVSVNGKAVKKNGEVLKHGSKIQAGSAKFIFLEALSDDKEKLTHKG